jgi:uncharacterized metal-binding protein
MNDGKATGDVYSETETQYYITVLRKTIKKKYTEDITKEEVDKLVK